MEAVNSQSFVLSFQSSCSIRGLSANVFMASQLFLPGSETILPANACPILCCACLLHPRENAVHFAQCIRYQPFGSDTDFDFHEIIVGPLNAGPFNRPDLDQTFSPERLFYYAPERKERRHAFVALTVLDTGISNHRKRYPRFR